MTRLPFSNETTSLEAAKRAEKGLNRSEQRVMDCILMELARCEDMTRRGIWHGKRSAGLTAEQVAFKADMRIQTVTARIRGLVRAGRLADSGEKRMTTANRRAIVWTPANGPCLALEVQSHGRIAAAVLREREECAKVCDRVAAEFGVIIERLLGEDRRNGGAGTVSRDTAARHAARECARGIRGRTKA